MDLFDFVDVVFFLLFLFLFKIHNFVYYSASKTSNTKVPLPRWSKPLLLGPLCHPVLSPEYSLNEDCIQVHSDSYN